MTERLSLMINEAYLRLRTLDFKREEGQGVTEYGLVLAFVAIALALVLGILHTKIEDFISTVGSDLAKLPGSF